MADQRHQVGKWGETTAADYLRGLGYRVICINYRASGGEIDLIAEHEDRVGIITVFVEVKTRTSQRYGYPEESITAKKWQNLMSAIEEYNHKSATEDEDWRVDVLAIQKTSGSAEAEIIHFKDVILNDEEE